MQYVCSIACRIFSITIQKVNNWSFQLRWHWRWNWFFDTESNLNMDLNFDKTDNESVVTHVKNQPWNQHYGAAKPMVITWAIVYIVLLKCFETWSKRKVMRKIVSQIYFSARLNLLNVYLLKLIWTNLTYVAFIWYIPWN